MELSMQRMTSRQALASEAFLLFLRKAWYGVWGVWGTLSEILELPCWMKIQPVSHSDLVPNVEMRWIPGVLNVVLHVTPFNLWFQVMYVPVVPAYSVSSAPAQRQLSASSEIGKLVRSCLQLVPGKRPTHVLQWMPFWDCQSWKNMLMSSSRANMVRRVE